jgi:uncharacterized membrane protein
MAVERKPARTESRLLLNGNLLPSVARSLSGKTLSPGWSAIGQLAAIATIRTVLNFYLARDLEKFHEIPGGPAPA